MRSKYYTSFWFPIKKIAKLSVKAIGVTIVALLAMAISFITLTPWDGHKVTRFKIWRIKTFYRMKIWIYDHGKWLCRLTNTVEYFKIYKEQYGMQLCNKRTT